MRGSAVVGVAALLLLAGCSSSAPATTPSAQVPVRQLLDALPVRAETHGVRFDRERFGYGGDLDPDGDGCFTRREVLIRDSIVPVTIGRSCRVSGEWRSWLDGRTTRDPEAVTIDHTVPLLEAWRSGADGWDSQRLVAYGNDLGYEWSLQAVTATLNKDKGNDDPAGWLPPAHQCAYVAGWVGVKARWRLSIDSRERAAIERVLRGCSGQEVAAPGVPDLAALT